MINNHVCYFANAASVHTQRWVNYFAERGWKVDVITWHPPSSANKLHPDIVVHRLLFPPHYIGLFGALVEVTALMRKIQPDIIHAHYVSHFGIVAGLYGHLSGFRPLVLTGWGNDVLTDGKSWKKPLIQFALRRADLITCDADHFAKALEKLGANPQKIQVIYFGTDARKFNPERGDEELKRKLELLDGTTVISIRSLAPIYDVGSLIQAAPLVLKEVPKAQFLIGGKGPEEGRLKDLAQSLGVSNSVRFLGLIPNDELPRYLASSDVYVSISLSDAGLAASTAEAMASGLPVVITDFGDNSKWVEEGVSGFLVPLRNPEALAKKIIYLLQNEDKRKSFGKAGRQIIEERNSYEKEMGKVEKLYIELIERYNK